MTSAERIARLSSPGSRGGRGPQRTSKFRGLPRLAACRSGPIARSQRGDCAGRLRLARRRARLTARAALNRASAAVAPRRRPVPPTSSQPRASRWLARRRARAAAPRSVSPSRSAPRRSQRSASRRARPTGARADSGGSASMNSANLNPRPPWCRSALFSRSPPPPARSPRPAPPAALAAECVAAGPAGSPAGSGWSSRPIGARLVDVPAARPPGPRRCSAVSAGRVGPAGSGWRDGGAQADAVAAPPAARRARAI
jgi:hypothetical protein